jgi:signal transduction histidine kinase
MSIELLKSTATDPQAESILRTIEVSAKRGADIVRQVLTFARGLEGERIEVQPNHLLHDIESIIKDTFPKISGWHSVFRMILGRFLAIPPRSIKFS